ncbi:DUF4114 domain-containing protein [Mastigocoleus testarum]|uniref:Plastocyanin-like domain-containing protein n=1 Tax=Mastigocoleus testarum BC008 TaxID=371196 RepID=A0A0V7ZMR4_9CYAN|nr:multicopper oxidase domain-containing protein [Mastigocoleus testarum]KST65755.1 hypothetical protein BC008_22520 [Mastigocoleus testarum BC008]
MVATVNLKDAYVIGKDNFDQWSTGIDENGNPFDTEGYLKVLPHPDEKIPFKDPLNNWRNDHQNGNFSGEGEDGIYYSSWGPEEVLEVTLDMDELTEFTIDGLGLLRAGDGSIPWLENKATPYEVLRAYNGMVPGPMLITEPGDKLKVTLNNNLDHSTNFHTHGLHVSPMGHGDNVLFSLAPDETWEVEIEIPEDHFIGTDWYHPHLHGETNVDVASGLGAFLLVNPPYDLPDLDKQNPVESPGFFMAINTFGIQQVDRKGQENDPLNTSTTEEVPAGTPLEVLGEENGQKVYELSDAPFVGYNAKPENYNSAFPAGDAATFSSAYGEGGLAEPVENVIHTVNGQYNPTMDLKTGEWNLFSLGNFSVNSFHTVQLVKEEEDGSLTPQEVNLVAIDGDAAGVVEGTRREITELPLLNPGSRVSVQHWFEEPGKYYFLSNATEEILGDDAPVLTKDNGFNDGHLIWGSQVLATVEVTGESTPTGDFPEAYDVLTEHSQEINELIEAAEQGDFEKERTFEWSANAGGALVQGNIPDDADVTTFEGIYTINGEYFSSEAGGGMPPLTMPMLGTAEVWNIINSSGISDEELAEIELFPGFSADIPLLEWHPFHIHQNDFVVLEINGIPVEDIEQNYLAGVLSDTIALPPSHEPGTATPENPYGVAQFNGDPSVVKILMEFQDFPGSYVNHCHILFHEDAGMMAVVRVILNTEDTWLGLGSNGGGTVELLKASNTEDAILLNPYGQNFQGEIDLAIADVNHKKPLDEENNNVTDNVTDVVTIQRSLEKADDDFTVKVFDGATLFERQTQGNDKLDGEDPALVIEDFNPFKDIDVSTEQKASIATGDINGDGFADVVVGLGEGTSPLIEVYSGKDYRLLTRLNSFHDESFTGAINLAVGDANGDNFDDIIVGQGSGGRGLVEIYNGLEIDKLIRNGEAESLDGDEVADKTSLLSEEFQPYGDSYTGEVEVTSGYVLQTPDEPNGERSQTNNANITTLAVNDVPDGHEQLKIHTFLGGHHTGHTTESDTDSTEHTTESGTDSTEHTTESGTDSTEHTTESGTDSTEHTTESDTDSTEMRVDKEFTPDGEIQELSGTFADIEGERGEGVIFSRQADGNYQLIHLKDQNEEESRVIESMLPLVGGGTDPNPSENPVVTPRLAKNNDKGIFNIQGSQTKVKLKISLTGLNSNTVNELGVFFVDDADGNINGIAPGASGYTQAALQRSKVAFSAITNTPNGFSNDNLTRLLEFDSGNNIRFLLARNSTIDAVLSGTITSSEVLFADVSTLRTTELSDDQFSLAWKDGSGNSTDFTDLVVNIKATDEELPLGVGLQGEQEGEILDFRDITGQVTAEFIVNREAVFDNFVGFYKIANQNGGIDTNGDGTVDLLPGDAGYVKAAVNGRLAGIDLSVNNQGTERYTGTFDTNDLFAPFIIADGKAEEILDDNTGNDPKVYFPFLGANEGQVDHVRLLADNTFGFEDLAMGGDQDYNDIILQINLSQG